MVVTRAERLRTDPAAAYRSTFAPWAPEPVPGGVLLPGWEGVYFHFDTAYKDLRPDGTPGAGDVVPEVTLPRRMYAGEDSTFHNPLRFGDPVEQRSSLGRMQHKTGRSGELVFADIERRYLVDGEVAVTSVWHDVFLPAPGAPGDGVAREATQVERTDWPWARQVDLDSRALFRFSALTFNTHRVHYDREWARSTEGLPDLLVHGPLLRMLLLDLVTASAGDRLVQAFSMRSLAPAYVDVPMRLVGGPSEGGAEAYALAEGGRLLARAAATFAPG